MVVYNGGHGQGLWYKSEVGNIAASDFTSAFQRDFLRQIAAIPCDIIYSSMPFDGENWWTRLPAYVAGVSQDAAVNLHEHLGVAPALKPSTGSPLRYFLEPAVNSISYALARKSYLRVAAAGISGGGWTTTMLAAVDPRITHSYAVAGSVPLAYRAPGHAGDWEQYKALDVWGTFDYFDMYLMAVAEPSRRAMLIYNGADPCCFQGGSASVQSWTWPFLYYAKSKGYGRLRVTNDPNNNQHSITLSQTVTIITDMLGD